MAAAASGQFQPRDLAQPSQLSPSEDSWRHYALFQMLLEEQGLTSVERMEDAILAPSRSVIVIAGHPLALPLHTWSRLRSFIQSGGSVLVIDEIPAILPGIGRFTLGPVQSFAPADQYQGFSDCLVIRELTDPNSQFSDVDTLVTNRANWFVPELNGWFQWQTIASFPDDAEPRGSRGMPLLAIGRSAVRGSGLLIVAADASLLSNGMLWHGDNSILAIRLSELLQAGTRDRLAFVQYGDLMRSYREQLGLPPIEESKSAPVSSSAPRPDLKTLLGLTNALAKDIADSGVLNESLKQRPRHWTASRYFRGLVPVLLTLAFAWFLWKLATNFPVRPIFPGRRRMMTAYEMRSRVGDQQGDFRQPAGHLSREFCLEVTGSRQSTDWQKQLAKALHSALPLTALEQQSLSRIFDIASRGCRDRMSESEFRQLGKTIAELRWKHLESLRSAMTPAPTIVPAMLRT